MREFPLTTKNTEAGRKGSHGGKPEAYTVEQVAEALRSGEPSCACVPFCITPDWQFSASFCHVLRNPKQDAAGTIKRFGNEATY
jgi:hypothetical protein